MNLLEVGVNTTIYPAYLHFNSGLITFASIKRNAFEPVV